jgi:hypothetical protein
MLPPVSGLHDVEPYEWHETSPGRFERYLDGVELFFTQINTAAVEIGAVRGRVTLEHSFDDILDRLKRAWIVLRYDHPFLAATTIGQKAVYQNPTPSELDEWVTKSLIVSSDVDDPVTRLKANVGAALFVIPVKRQVNVMLKCPHRFIDGLGMVQLLNNLIQLVVNPRTVTFGNEAKSLTPSLRVAAAISNPATEKVHETMDTLKEYLSRAPSNRLKPLGQSSERSIPTWKIMTFSPEDTAKIVKGAKGNGVTVTHLVCAGIGLAVKVTGGDDGPWQNLVPLSLRPYMLPPYDNTALYPVSCWVLQIPVVAELTDLISTSKQIKAAYTSIPKEAIAIRAATWDQFYDKAGSADMSKITTPNVACLGVLDPLFSTASIPTIKVSNLQLGIDSVDEGYVGLTFHAWTFQGSFQIGASYRGGKYTEEAILECLKQISTTFEEGLDVQLNPGFGR